ncbi:PD-(D/E)XK nuclease family protein [Thermodesulfobacterium hveragerdense]|uniref:PD-(D/E)XK nuclease family protein n=1 Tax=Thermodesulfobacterium hveragerdense TaxID=53424 RepID=UPI00048E0929|nr:PD-(D/E)XK nuclease family protein [Thermodesulfobacterium hveragerdense]
MPQAILIPANSHFLKTLINFFLDGRSLDESILKTWIVFPNKRSALFFKRYLKEKGSKNKAGFFPRIFSLETLVDYLYVMLEDKPCPTGTKILRLLPLLEVFPQVLSENVSESFEKNFFWGIKFLEVFEELEKEDREPQNLVYPPENLPPIAQDIFEKLKKLYLEYNKVLNQKGLVSPTFRLKRVAEILENTDLKETFLGSMIEEVWLVGFAGLRKIEEKLFKAFLKNFEKTFLVFQVPKEDPAPLPNVVKNTLQLFGINQKYRFLPKDYYAKEVKPTSINFYRSTDLHLEITQALDLVNENPQRPDEVAFVLSDPNTLIPLIYKLEQKDLPLEVNVSLFYPMDSFPLNSLLTSVIKAQRDRIQGLYPTQSYLKVIKHPILNRAFSDNIFWEEFLKAIENFIRNKGYITIDLGEIEKEFGDYRQGKYTQDLIEKIIKDVHQVFFKNWENLRSPKDIAKNLEKILDFLKLKDFNLDPQSSFQDIVLHNYLEVIETEVLPFFTKDYLPSVINNNKENLLTLLEYLLKTQKVPLFGDPLTGLQILGVMETRLLSFKKLILLDVNEGSFPSSPDFNPLLTDEIKSWLKIPVFNHNELWSYYFDTIINSAEEVHIFYLLVEKSTTQEVKEPSRFIHRLKWELEQQGNSIEEKIIQPNLCVFSKREEGIPKTETIKESLFNHLSRERVSRYYFETYLKCGAKFFFKYIMKLKEPERLGFKVEDPGNFIHSFFKEFFSPYKGKTFLISKICDENSVKINFEKLWKNFEFERKLDPLSEYLSRTITLASIYKYFNFLKKEEEKKIKSHKLLALEEGLEAKEEILLCDGRTLNITFYGIFDFLIEREEEVIKYLIMDFKSNPSISPQPKKMKEFISKYSLPDKYDLESLRSILENFGESLANFQLFFYCYLFYRNKQRFISPNIDKYIINAGFIRPSNFEKPEVFLFNLKKKEGALVNQFFEKEAKKFLEWVVKHMLFAEKFYFTENENICNYCEYLTLCKNYRYLI